MLVPLVSVTLLPSVRSLSLYIYIVDFVLSCVCLASADGAGAELLLTIDQWVNGDTTRLRTYAHHDYDTTRHVLTITHWENFQGDMVEKFTLAQLAEMDPERFERFYVETAAAGDAAAAGAAAGAAAAAGDAAAGDAATGATAASDAAAAGAPTLSLSLCKCYAKLCVPGEGAAE
jgi:hypothetical protein